jgi:hypothetical protein
VTNTEPPFDASRDIDVDGYLRALRAEGREPEVISMSTWRVLSEEQRAGADWLVLQDETFKEWAD